MLIGNENDIPRETVLNLVKVGKLKAEPPDQAEIDGLIKSELLKIRATGRKLPDAQNTTLSPESLSILAYDAMHSLVLAALL